jgi:hypothetical protein
VVAHVSSRSNVPVDQLEIIANGEVVREVPLTVDRTRVSADVRLPVRRSGWFLLWARADRAVRPVLDLYPMPRRVLSTSSSGASQSAQSETSAISWRGSTG